jgi:hypothetical protein
VIDDEVRRVLFLLSSIWSQKVSEPTLEVWRKRLAAFDDYAFVVESIERLADTSRYWPTIADLVETYAAVARSHHPTLYALPPPGGEALSKEETRAMLKQCRASLRSV